MRRRLFTILSAISLGLLVLVLIWWMAAQTVTAARVTYRWEDRPTSVRVWVNAVGWTDDGIHMGHWDVEYTDDQPAYLAPVRQSLSRTFGPPDRTVLEWHRQLPPYKVPRYPYSARGGSSEYGDIYRFWHLAIAFSVLPLIWLAVFVLRSIRLAKGAWIGTCPVCGYDLRATPHQCPECGTVPAVHSASRR